MTVHLALRVVSLESRRSDEMGRLLVRHGLVPIYAPSMREVPVDDQEQAFAFGEALAHGRCDLLVLLTGVGARALVDTLATRWPLSEVLASLAATTLVCRGPKPVAVLKELGLKPTLTAPEPNTWRELLTAMDGLELNGKRVWVQEYGRSNDALLDALRARGAEVHQAAVYAWRLPQDTGPLQRAIAALCAGEVEAVVFTSGRQLDHLVEIAERTTQREALLATLQSRVVIVSIGPVTSEALEAYGLRPDLQPEHPKMGHIAKLLAREGLHVLEKKRALGRP
jgi:uroporphyrinogen-III synthase